MYSPSKGYRWPVITFTRETHSNLNRMIRDSHFWDVVKTGGTIPHDIAVFGPGEILTFSDLVTFITRNYTDLEFRHSIEFQKLAIYSAGTILGIVHVSYPNKYPWGRCNVCGEAGIIQTRKAGSRESLSACAEHKPALFDSLENSRNPAQS